MSSSRGVGEVVDWFVRRWEDLSGARRELIRQQGELLRAHLQLKAELLKGRPGAEVPKEDLYRELRETSEELRKTFDR